MSCRRTSDLPRGVANAGGKVANNQHRRMASILKGPQLTHGNAVAQVNFSAGGVNPQFDPQGTLGLPTAAGSGFALYR